MRPYVAFRAVLLVLIAFFGGGCIHEAIAIQGQSPALAVMAVIVAIVAILIILTDRTEIRA